MYLLSVYQAKQLLEAYELKSNFRRVSLDLGKTVHSVKIEDKFILPDGQEISVEDVKEIIKKEKICFKIENSKIEEIKVYSEATKRFYKLYPTGINSPPTLEICGFRMHVTKDYNPKTDTYEKIRNVKPLRGRRLLDCNMGLGYTAIFSWMNGALVTTCEKDKNVIEICKLNPWSAELFNSDIKVMNVDSFEQVKKFEDNSFDRIIADPPSFRLAGQLYSKEYYIQLYRILDDKGKLYHYTGKVGEKRGIDIAAGVMKRLGEVGFHSIKRSHYGVVANK